MSYEPQDFIAREAYVIVIVNVWKLRDEKCIELRNYSTLDEPLSAI